MSEVVQLVSFPDLAPAPPTQSQILIRCVTTIEMSGEQIDSVEAVLDKYIPAGDDLDQIKRVLYGKPAK